MKWLKWRSLKRKDRKGCGHWKEWIKRQMKIGRLIPVGKKRIKCKDPSQ